MQKNWKTFAVTAAVALLGTAASLDWSQVLTTKTAGVLAILIASGIAIIKAFQTPTTEQVAAATVIAEEGKPS